VEWRAGSRPGRGDPAGRKHRRDDAWLGARSRPGQRLCRATLNHGRKYSCRTHDDPAPTGGVTSTLCGRRHHRPGRRNHQGGGLGELQLHGSARLAQACSAAGGADRRVRLLVFRSPSALASGVTDDAPPRGYSMLESRTTRAGGRDRCWPRKPSRPAASPDVHDGGRPARVAGSRYGSQHGKSTGRKNHGPAST